MKTALVIIAFYLAAAYGEIHVVDGLIEDFTKLMEIQHALTQR